MVQCCFFSSTQNQAKAAILYWYKQVLGVDLPWLDDVVQAKTPKCLPVMLTATEVRALLSLSPLSPLSAL